MMEWQPIETAPKWPDRRNFLVCAWFDDTGYMTDPWVVFRDIDNNFCRWPHDLPPTMWAEIVMPERPAMTSPIVRLRDAIVAGEFRPGGTLDRSLPWSNAVGPIPGAHARSACRDNSVDAALAFKDAVLPDWAIDRMTAWPGACRVEIVGTHEERGERWHTRADGFAHSAHPQLAVALILACLAPLIEKETT